MKNASTPSPSTRAPDPPARGAEGASSIIEGLRRDAVDARARVCFRAISLCLAAVVMFIVTLGLHAATRAFIEVARQDIAGTEGLRAVPAFIDLEALNPPRRSASNDWPHSMLAVITALLVSDVVLAIGLVRATFAMTVGKDVESPQGATRPGDPVALPALEMLKAANGAISTVLEGIQKR